VDQSCIRDMTCLLDTSSPTAIDGDERLKDEAEVLYTVGLAALHSD